MVSAIPSGALEARVASAIERLAFAEQRFPEGKLRGSPGGSVYTNSCARQGFERYRRVALIEEPIQHRAAGAAPSLLW